MLTLHVSARETKTSFVTLQEHELKYIKEVLTANQANIKKTAKILDISRARLYRKLRLAGMDVGQESGSENEKA